MRHNGWIHSKISFLVHIWPYRQRERLDIRRWQSWRRLRLIFTAARLWYVTILSTIQHRPVYLYKWPQAQQSRECFTKSTRPIYPSVKSVWRLSTMWPWVEYIGWDDLSSWLCWRLGSSLEYLRVWARGQQRKRNRDSKCVSEWVTKRESSRERRGDRVRQWWWQWQWQWRWWGVSELRCTRCCECPLPVSCQLLTYIPLHCFLNPAASVLYVHWYQQYSTFKIQWVVL
jgi:hypothetical protein